MPFRHVETFSRVHAFTWCGRLAPLLRSLTPEASQLRIYVSTFNLRFTHLNGDHLGAVKGQQPRNLSYFFNKTTNNCCTTQGRCSPLYSALERKFYLTYSPCDSLGQNSLDQSYNRVVKQLISLSTLSRQLSKLYRLLHTHCLHT